MEAVLDITKEIPVVFLGNKCDLEDEMQVSPSELSDFATKYKKTHVFLSSAKTGHNVDLAFKTLGEDILKDS
jgi:GTPase SAR1 family protein